MKENLKYIIVSLAIVLSAVILGKFIFDGFDVLGQYIEHGLRTITIPR